mmetsp:Transcript_10757/g.26345  ORF Transcript_10757/g.26345 Transcript_10757/m.26345 type:complete len:213 (+) Transcript_10757:35-673(+)
MARSCGSSFSSGSSSAGPECFLQNPEGSQASRSPQSQQPPAPALNIWYWWPLAAQSDPSKHAAHTQHVGSVAHEKHLNTISSSLKICPQMDEQPSSRRAAIHAWGSSPASTHPRMLAHSSGGRSSVRRRRVARRRASPSPWLMAERPWGLCRMACRADWKAGSGPSSGRESHGRGSSSSISASSIAPRVCAEAASATPLCVLLKPAPLRDPL